MNPKRNAELQRKLTLTPVPKPPVELLDRIKNDIPKYLEPEGDRTRFARSLSFNMRVAAAVLVVLSSVVATVYLLEPGSHLSEVAAKAPAPKEVATPYLDTTGTTATVSVEIAEQQHQRPVMQVANVSRDTAAPPPARFREEKGRNDDAPSGGEVEGAVSGSIASAAPLAVAESESAPVPAPAPAVPAPAAAEPQPAVAAAAPAMQTRAAKIAGPSLVSEAVAADFDLGPRSSAFGISVDPGVFHRIRESLERDRRPSAGLVDLEAIVNYFAGPPVKRVRSGVRLEVEASPSPIGGIGDHGFLRFTIDTSSAESRLPVASDAKLSITLNEKAVARAQAIGDSGMREEERALLPNLSVTGLYEVALKPGLRPGDRVATVTLSYTNVSDGKRNTEEKTVYARDFGKVWTRASRRHRLASLGAVWGQSLKGAPDGSDVARRAEELATEEPSDRRAQELATAASASSKLAGGF
jgi:hypothetical protein